MTNAPASHANDAAVPEQPPRVLVVDDEPALRHIYARALKASGLQVDEADDGQTAIEQLERHSYDVIVSDISMPLLNGLGLLRAVRKRDQDVPVVLVTGTPSLETAVDAIEYGALRYLIKPVEIGVLVETVRHASRLHRLARIRREAVTLLGRPEMQLGDRVNLELAFERALGSMWMAYQPIIRSDANELYAYEALLRSSEPTLIRPDAFVGAAERLLRVHELGRAIRAHIAGTLSGSPEVPCAFVNLHPDDLRDESIFSPSSPLSAFASRVVLEITERASLDHMVDAHERIVALRKMGYRIALDDLGAGYAGLTSFVKLTPDIVKLDMALVRNSHREPIKRNLIRSVTQVCKEMGMLVVAEGIELPEEREVLRELGCDLFQGYLFAKPGPPFPGPAY